MGAEQSSQHCRDNPNERNPAKNCYYEVLGVGRQATGDEIKKSYRKKALELHPDRNYGDVENATAKFAEVQSAYEILSDPQERAWYDSHRESILRGGSGSPSDKNRSEHDVHVTSAEDIVSLISRFNPRISFTDGPDGFYGALRKTFANLAEEEYAACDWDGLEPVEYPDFGSSTDEYENGVKLFYRAWINFSTKKSFSWRDIYKASDAPDRATRRLIERENKRCRDEGIREFNDAVRALVTFVRKRDPRFTPNSQSESDRQKILRDVAAAQAARSRAANQAKFDLHVVQDWAKTTPPAEYVDISESEESEVEHIECVVCGKIFKSEKQYETHEKSKKHIKAVQQLQREMKRENKRLNLDNLSDRASSVPAEEFEELELEDKTFASESNPPSPVNETETGHSELPDSPDIDLETVQGLNNSIRGVKEQTSDGSLESDDEYAPRQAVEDRLAGNLLGAQGGSGQITTTACSTVASDDENTAQPKIGKAKAKRAKKATRQEADIQDNIEFKCLACNGTFPSKSKLFSHIKELDHAQPVPKARKGKIKNR